MSDILDKAEDQLDWLESYLAAWGEPYGATAKALDNMQLLWAEAYQTSNAPRILMACNGETPRGGAYNSPHLHRVDRQWAVAIMRGHGWSITPKDTGPKQEWSFLKVIEAVREHLRKSTCLSQDFPIEYRGWKPLPNLAPSMTGNLFLNAALIEFATTNDLPAVARTAAESAQYVSPAAGFRVNIATGERQVLLGDGFWHVLNITPDGQMSVEENPAE